MGYKIRKKRVKTSWNKNNPEEPVRVASNSPGVFLASHTLFSYYIETGYGVFPFANVERKRLPDRKQFQNYYNKQKRTIERRLALIIKKKKPVTVYEPMTYVLSSGGKRLRAVLTLLACEAVGGQARHALDAAVGMEILHNFTLVHDDVMDHAKLRRNRPTVHTRWDNNIAILAGDQLAAYAYRSLLKTPDNKHSKILPVFTGAFIDVCEGQGFDKEFETRDNVRLKEYVMMIEKKTAAIIAASTEIGAIIGGGSARQVRALRNFGMHLGRAFQINDDLLDIAGDPEEFGKTVGGDIIEGKKTFLLLTAIGQTRGRDRLFLLSLSPANGMRRVKRIQTIYRQTETLSVARKTITRHTRSAHNAIKQLPVNRGTAMLGWLANQLVERIS